MKRYKEADEVLNNVSEVTTDLFEFENLMIQIPKHKKNQGGRKIFQRKEFSIYKVADGFIIHNTNKKFEKGHTHVRSFSKAKSIIDLCVRKKLPSTPKYWEIQCLLRLTNNQTYKNKLLILLEEL